MSDADKSNGVNLRRKNVQQEESKTTKWNTVHWLLAPILIPVTLFGFIIGVLVEYFALGFHIGRTTE